MVLHLNSQLIPRDNALPLACVNAVLSYKKKFLRKRGEKKRRGKKWATTSNRPGSYTGEFVVISTHTQPPSSCSAP
ncbi:hypothetical protein AMECASPLE_002960 [Ameca splendens]|uniref:Uncharacterized protein n=1 Tax=Ameca splendens TaxID=208324 RepID=A0ABV0ZUC4_9TELE